METYKLYLLIGLSIFLIFRWKWYLNEICDGSVKGAIFWILFVLVTLALHEPSEDYYSDGCVGMFGYSSDC